MPDLNACTSADRLDPDIARFVCEMGQAYARHPNLANLSAPESRAICEAVRASWAQGGPSTAVQERFVETPDGAARIRIYTPARASPGPALVYLHGGGWVLFSLDTHDRVMREYADRSGIVVVGVDYALSPEAKFPTALNQATAIVRWLAHDGEALGINPQRLAVGGDSAGANLAIGVCLKLRDAGEGGRLRGMLLNYGAFDDVCSEAAQAQYGGPGYMLTAEEMAGFYAAYLGRPADREDPLARPMLAELHDLPPAFLTIPECDVLTEQSLAMAERLREAGGAVRAEVYAGATHSFLEAVSISPLASRALQDGADWLRQTLGLPS